MSLYYVQDKRQYVGNSMLWWAKGGGYTTDLSRAEKHERKPTDRDTDVLWPVEYIDNIASLHVDVQRTDMAQIQRPGVLISVGTDCDMNPEDGGS